MAPLRFDWVDNLHRAGVDLTEPNHKWMGLRPGGHRLIRVINGANATITPLNPKIKPHVHVHEEHEWYPDSVLRFTATSPGRTTFVARKADHTPDTLEVEVMPLLRVNVFCSFAIFQGAARNAPASWATRRTPALMQPAQGLLDMIFRDEAGINVKLILHSPVRVQARHGEVLDLGTRGNPTVGLETCLRRRLARSISLFFVRAFISGDRRSAGTTIAEHRVCFIPDAVGHDNLDPPHLYYALAHEIGHALGLEDLDADRGGTLPSAGAGGCSMPEYQNLMYPQLSEGGHLYRSQIYGLRETAQEIASR